MRVRVLYKLDNYQVYDNEQSGTRLRRMVDLFKEHAGWQALGFFTWEQFCESKLQKQAQDVEVTITLRMTTQARAEQPKELSANGKHLSSDNSKGIGDKAGNSADYLTARIARDRPDISLHPCRRGINDTNWCQTLNQFFAQVFA